MERSGEHRRASDTMAIKIPGRQLVQRIAGWPLFKLRTATWRGHGKGDDGGLGSLIPLYFAFDGIEDVRCATFQRARTTSG